MLYPYAVLANDLTVTYTQVIKDSNNTKILVHFEQPTDYGFKEARYSLPGFVEVYNYNYTQSETERTVKETQKPVLKSPIYATLTNG